MLGDIPKFANLCPPATALDKIPHRLRHQHATVEYRPSAPSISARRWIIDDCGDTVHHWQEQPTPAASVYSASTKSSLLCRVCQTINGDIIKRLSLVVWNHVMNNVVCCTVWSHKTAADFPAPQLRGDQEYNWEHSAVIFQQGSHN